MVDRLGIIEWLYARNLRNFLIFWDLGVIRLINIFTTSFCDNINWMLVFISSDAGVTSSLESWWARQPYFWWVSVLYRWLRILALLFYVNFQWTLIQVVLQLTSAFFHSLGATLHQLSNLHLISNSLSIIYCLWLAPCMPPGFGSLLSIFIWRYLWFNFTDLTLSKLILILPKRLSFIII